MHVSAEITVGMRFGGGRWEREEVLLMDVRSAAPTPGRVNLRVFAVFRALGARRRAMGQAYGGNAGFNALGW